MQLNAHEVNSETHSQMHNLNGAVAQTRGDMATLSAYVNARPLSWRPAANYLTLR